ncbi:MAG: GDP-L-fucose synthase, partial [Verrucomicrobiota bacterium]
MEESEKIFVAGHGGLVGSALVRRLEADGFRNLVKRDRSQLDLTQAHAVQDFF